MKLMPIKQAQAKFFNATSDKGLQAITLYTFKKDRSVTLEREENGWVLIENGFENDRVALISPKDKRLVKEAFKREFPRSTRAYVSERRVS